MSHLVAIEAGLEPIKDALRNHGFGVLSLEGQEWKKADAIVVSGMDSNLASFHEASIAGPVIRAEGMTSEEVIEEVCKRLR